MTEVQLPCCVYYIATETLRQGASFQPLPCEALVLGSSLIRFIRRRNVLFSSIERIERMCRLHVQNAGVYLYKSLAVGKGAELRNIE